MTIIVRTIPVPGAGSRRGVKRGRTAGRREGRPSPAGTPWALLNDPRLHAAVLLFAVLIIYSNTFNAPFLFDDKTKIVNNAEIRSLTNFWRPSGTRWLGFLSFALNYRWGQLDPAGYHAVNLAIHAANALLVYWLAVLTLNTPRMGDVPRGRQYFAAFFAAFLFACHPLQTQAVTYIWQRVTSLATLFYLSSLVAYIRFRIAGAAGGATAGGKRPRWYALSILFAVCAMMTKEISFTLPFIIVLYEFSFFKHAGQDTRARISRRVLVTLPFLATLVLIPLVLFGPGLAPPGPGEGVSDELRRMQLQDLTTLSKHDYLLTQFRVIATYIRLLVLPVGQNLDYDYPVARSFLDAGVLLSFLLLLSFLALGIRLFRASGRSQGERGNWQRLIGFGIFWFFLALSVESSVIPIYDVIYEHRVYLPSVGFFLAVIAAVELAGMRWERSRRMVLVILALAGVAYASATYARNIVWGDSVRFWEDNAQKSPGKVRPRLVLGDMYQEKGQYDKAVAEYRVVLQLDPAHAVAHSNLGAAYERQGRLDEALREYRIALSENPNLADTRNNLGAIYANKGRIPEAVSEFREALRLNPNHERARRNLDIVLRKMQHTRAAVPGTASGGPSSGR